MPSDARLPQAYVLIEKMRDRQIVLNPYLDADLIEQVYQAMGIDINSNAGGEEGMAEELDEDIEEDM